MPASRVLGIDSVLLRTEKGTAKMRSRTSDITPKLRSVLFLIDGEQTLGDLLGRAGSLANLLESQIKQLIALELVAVEGSNAPGRDPNETTATTPVARHKPKPADIPPVVAAKMQLLLRLEGTGSNDVDLLGAELLEAKTLKELAYTAKSVTNQLSMSVGTERSQQFWKDAKEILTAWRDMAARGHAEDGA
ncbi:MAG: hypothetical protein JNK75_05280 [Betaproteobacteria bacterium]|nr:hypothetical protein [Betaproteobacteria bacterium]